MTVQEFRRIFAGLTPHGWLSEGEALCLVDWAERTEGPMVEVGSYCGRSSELLAHLQRPLLCIDKWEDGFSDLGGDGALARFCESIAKANNRFVAAVRSKVESEPPSPTPFAYLDGDHTYTGTLNQVKFALKCEAQVICAHDVNDAGGGVEVKRACLELLGPWDERVERLAAWDLRKLKRKLDLRSTVGIDLAAKCEESYTVHAQIDPNGQLIAVEDSKPAASRS